MKLKISWNLRTCDNAWEYAQNIHFACTVFSGDNLLLKPVKQCLMLEQQLHGLVVTPSKAYIKATIYGTPIHLYMDCMMYADDSQLYIVINPRSDRPTFLSKIELCVSDVFTCCTSNGLACNPGKTEVVHFRSCHARTCEPIKTITIGNAAFSAMPVVRDLRALLDQHLLLKKQINNICKGAWYVIQKRGRMRPYLS